jgi:hypothetical protein
MRPTDFCHLNDLRAPVPRAFPVHSAAFTACAPHGVLGSVRLDQGTECFTTLENASADRSWTRAAYCLPPFPAPSPANWIKGRERGRFLPTAPAPIEPLTPLSPLPLPRNVRSAFASPSSFCSCERYRFSA